MPKLKRVELQGFKSFADPATFHFPTGITAVVGPNGSGKSNVMDAIRWVLGEQRMSTIRGRTGEDMIFAGSGKRPRAGMARVAITFDNSDGWLPVDFAEVTVERRAYRDGTSDYMLNGSRVRLMDLRDVLDRAGLGRDAYLVIGQGLVDQVLSLRPHERLALFEQAAGITPYRTRREDAVERLEDTRRNLQRVYDIVGEIEPRLRRLQRQATRVDEHARLRQELSSTLRIWYGYRWSKALSEFEQARQRVAYHEDRALAVLEEVEAISEGVAEQRQSIAARRERLTELHRESSTQHNSAGTRQRELAVARERQRQLRERLEETEANLVPLRSALTSEHQDVASLDEALRTADTSITEARARLDDVAARHEQLSQRRHVALRRQAEAQAKALEGRHQLGDRQNRLAQADERLAALAELVSQLESDVAAGLEQRRSQQRTVETARQELDAEQAALLQAQQVEGEAEQAVTSARSDSERSREALERYRADLQRTSVRLEALDRLHAEGAGMYAGVRAAMQAVERGELQGLPGPISTLIRVPAELERAIEAALGSQLQDIVAHTWDDAQRAIAWLKRQKAGRATFLPLDTLRPPSPLRHLPSPSVASPGGEGSRRGVIGVASELVDYDAVYGPAVLLLLGRTAIVEDLDAARRLLDELRGSFRIVTLEGEIVRSSGAVTGGEGRQAQGPGLLSRERERRELRRRNAELSRTMAEATRAHKEADGRVVAATEARDICVARRREAESQVRERDRAVDRVVRDLERVLQEAEWRQDRLAQATLERDQMTELVQRLRVQCAEIGSALDGVQAALTQLDAEVSDLSDDGVARTLAERRTEVAVLEQEQESRRVLLESRRRETRRLERQISEQAQRSSALHDELTQIDATLSGLVTTYEAARAEADALAGEIPPLETELRALESALEAQTEQEQSLRRALRESEQRLSQAEVEANRREDQLQSLRHEIEETLEIVISNLPDSISTQHPLPLDDLVSPLPSVTELPSGLEGQLRDLRTQIRRLEPVNPAAREEYEELAERHTFLREQMDDLERASLQLREIIAELDEMMDVMFSTTFKSIATEFSRVFELLFNGGSAHLHLSDVDEGRAGVEISARPPGKRASSLAMLSGGERSLTAVALIFAVMHISPTPFCVLDEVDAMLDEANVGRFRRMLRELARETQFVIITHNRGTVEVADTIYGISMGENGVSETLSLDLENLPTSEAI